MLWTSGDVSLLLPHMAKGLTRTVAVAVTPYPDDEPDRSILRKEIGRCFYNTDYSNTNAGLSRAEILTAKHKSGVLTGATFVEYYGNRSRYEAYTAAKSEADVRKTSLQPELWLWKDSLPSVSQRPSTKNDQVKSEGQKTVGFKEPEIEAPSLTTTIKDEDQHA